MIQPFLITLAVMLTAKFAHDIMHTSLTVIAVIVGTGAAIAAMKTIWREVIMPPTKILQRIEDLIELFEGKDDNESLDDRLGTLEEGQEEIIARLESGDRQFEEINKVLNIVASDDRENISQAIKHSVHNDERFRPDPPAD